MQFCSVGGGNTRNSRVNTYFLSPHNHSWDGTSDFGGNAGQVVYEWSMSYHNKIMYTSFWSLAEVVWQPNAIALAVASVTHQTELIYRSGRRQMLPRGWLPLSWSPAGNQLLVQHGALLGLRSVPTPHQVAVLGKTSRDFTVLNVDWLANRAPL